MAWLLLDITKKISQFDKELLYLNYHQDMDYESDKPILIETVTDFIEEGPGIVLIMNEKYVSGRNIETVCFFQSQSGDWHGLVDWGLEDEFNIIRYRDSAREDKEYAYFIQNKLPFIFRFFYIKSNLTKFVSTHRKLEIILDFEIKYNPESNLDYNEQIKEIVLNRNYLNFLIERWGNYIVNKKYFIELL